MVVAERVDGHEDQVGRVARGAPFGRRRIHRRRAGRRRPPAGEEHRHDGRAHEDADHGPSEKPPRDGRGDQTRGHPGHDAREAGDGRPAEHEQDAFAPVEQRQVRPYEAGDGERRAEETERHGRGGETRREASHTPPGHRGYSWTALRRPSSGRAAAPGQFATSVSVVTRL